MTTKKPKEQIGTIDELLALCEIDEWDILIIGDGSATGWKRPMGWASVLLDRFTGEWKISVGSNTFGTIGLAEMMGCWLLLLYHERNIRSRVFQTPYKVHVFSDNQSVVGVGNDVAKNREFATFQNAGLWKAIDETGWQGQLYELKWHWVKRETIEIHSFTDRLAYSAAEYAANFMPDALPDVPSMLK